MRYQIHEPLILDLAGGNNEDWGVGAATNIMTDTWSGRCCHGSAFIHSRSWEGGEDVAVVIVVEIRPLYF